MNNIKEKIRWKCFHDFVVDVWKLDNAELLIDDKRYILRKMREMSMIENSFLIEVALCDDGCFKVYEDVEGGKKLW